MKNIAIFASGSGTNAENITRLFHQGNKIRVSVVLANKQGIGVYDRMKALGVPVIYVPNKVWAEDPARVLEILAPYHPDLILLAGFLRPVAPEIIKAYHDRILNIHPALLPAYGGKGMYGHHVHEAVIAAGEKQSGVTVHYVSEQIDGGRILMQQRVDVAPDDTPDTLAEKIHQVEYSLFPRAIVAALQQLDSPAPASEAAPAVPGAPEIPGAPAVPQPKAAPSVDEQWAEVLQIKYSDSEAAARAAGAAASASAPAVPPASPGQKPKAAATPPAPMAPADKPKSYLWVSILVTILCCTVLGIVAIVYSSQVSSRLAVSDYAGARKASDRAQAWIIASFVTGVLWSTIIYPIYIFSSMIF